MEKENVYNPFEAKVEKLIESIKNIDVHDLCYYTKQKAIGLFFIILSIWSATSGMLVDPITQENDCTFAIIALPLGLILLFTKNRWILEDSCEYDDELEE